MRVEAPSPIGALGAHLVCPVCGLLRINHDCIVEIEKAKHIKPKPRAKKKQIHKEKPWDGVPSVFFGWSTGFGDSKKKVGRQRGFKNKKAIWWGKKDADYISVGKFKKGGAGKYRTLENLVSIDVCFSDIDAGFPLDYSELLEACEKNNIPKPNLIVKTPTANHYQVCWNIPEIDKSLLWLWESVQRGIFALFEELGADGQAVDAIRYLRNPNKCEKVYENKGEKNSLSVLYRALKQAGFIEYEKWPTKFGPNFKPMKASRETLEKFLKDNPECESTYAELSNRLGIPERTVKHLCKQFKRDGRLETLVKGKGKGRRTKFNFKVHIKSIKNTLPFNGVDSQAQKSQNSLDAFSGKEKKESDWDFFQALVCAKAVGFSRGVRNFGFFGLALWCRVAKRMVYEEVFKELYPVLIVTPGFSRREFEKTVKSACRDRYRNCISAKKFEKVFISLGLGGVKHP